MEWQAVSHLCSNQSSQNRHHIGRRQKGKEKETKKQENIIPIQQFDELTRVVFFFQKKIYHP